MSRDSFPEKGVAGSPARPIEELGGQDNVARGIFLVQTANCRHANDPAHVKRTQRVNVRTMIQFVRQDSMAASVSRQKINGATEHGSPNDEIGGRAERCLDFVFSQPGETFHVVEAAPADNSNRWLVHGWCD